VKNVKGRNQMQIFCLVGASGSGKDTLCNEIVKRKLATPIVTYTTRPIRPNEKNGREYNFVTEQEYQDFKSKGKIVEERSYNTKHGVWRYFVANDGQFDTATRNKYILVDSLEGATSLVQKFGAQICVVHIHVDDETRLQRCIEREKAGKKDYVELCRRFFHDAEDFSQEKFNKLIYWIVVENQNLDKAIHDLSELVEGF
jgi:guanylate kinase